MRRHLLFSVLIGLVFVSVAHGQTCPSEHSPGVLWSGAEHWYLGDQGFSEACAETQSTNVYCQGPKVPRKDKKLSLTYGQVLTLGDFYLEEELAWEEDGNTEISNGGMKRIFKCIDKQGKVHEEQREKPEVDYPHCQWAIFFNSRHSLQTVMANIEHFGWNNMKAYVRAHTKALNEAKLAGELRAQGDLEGSDLHLRKALYLNAFGDHFLTDAFAAGHIRVPRRQLKSWGEDRLGGLFKKFKGDILSMALHDTEAKDPQGFEIGFPVKNSENLRWRTRSDSKLNECRQESHIGIRMPVEAVSQSVREVLLAYEEGSIPIGVFAAAALVPYADDSGLEAKVAALAGEEGLDHLAERLRDALPSVLKLIISEGDFRKMLTNMGSIMGLFRQDVARDLERDSKLSERLPRAYIDAYLNVN